MWFWYAALVGIWALCQANAFPFLNSIQDLQAFFTGG